MQCSDTRPLLDLLADGMLEPKDCALVLDHLDSCLDCHREWNELENLRNRFRDAKEKTSMSDDLLDKISDSLGKEQHKQTFQHYLKLAPTMAAAFLLVSVLVFAWQHEYVAPSSVHSASAEILVDGLASNSDLEPVKDKSLLSQKLGYDIKYLQLAAWQMESCGIYKSATQKPIARFDFVRSDGSRAQRMSCYQAPEGTIRAGAGQSKLIGDKRVLLGSRGPLRFALWSQNGRDYLFVTALAQNVLEEIVRKA